MQELHPYEVMVVLDPEADEARQEDVIARIRQIVEAAGGQLEAADSLGRQRLAYEILKRSEAFRWVVTLTAPAGRGRGGRSRAAHPRRRAAAHDRASHRPLDGPRRGDRARLVTDAALIVTRPFTPPDPRR